MWCDPDLDGRSMMFNQPPPAQTARDVDRSEKNGTVYYVTVTDVAALREHDRAKGLPVTDLRGTHYGMMEFELRDPDENRLWFGQPTDDAPAPHTPCTRD